MKAFKLIVPFLLSAALLSVNTGHAQIFHDIDFPDELTLSGSRTPIYLNGVGYRTKLFFKIYTGALYLPEKSSSPPIIFEMTGPKRMQMNFLYEEVDRQKLVDSWNEGFTNNLDAESLAKLASRIKKFNDFFPTLREGDVVLLDYVPGVGTRINIKGNELGVIKGRDFFEALLRIWLGDEPADEDLKESVLGL